MRNGLLVVLCLFALSSCTVRDWHQGLKVRQKNECYSMPESQRRDCLQSLDYSYEEYLEEHQKSREQER
jgi:hypothetical protein